jgi:hypothetical protein
MLSEAARIEHVLVVPTPLFHSLGHFQGFRTDAGRYLEVLLQPSQVSYRPRHMVEDDPGFKQLIPYCRGREDCTASAQSGSGDTFRRRTTAAASRCTGRRCNVRSLRKCLSIQALQSVAWG